MNRIDLKQLGNVGNRMIQYAFARRLCDLLDPCEIVNVNLPEWQLSTGPGEAREFERELTYTDFDLPSLPVLLSHIRDCNPIKVELTGFFQDLKLLPSRDQTAGTIFPTGKEFLGRFSSSQLLINIRAGDILSGISWYPLVPIDFYKDLVAKTGLEPVFIGQLGPSRYVDRLRVTFPDAEFVDTGKPMDDFALIRSARNICISVSTFSWLAAWLSDATQIFYPLLGFLHPSVIASFPQRIAPTNLVPTDDPRYRYFLFPLMYGLPEQQMLEHHDRISGSWKEIPAAQVAVLRDDTPFVNVQEVRTLIDPVWYVHNHASAAEEISAGWYGSPLMHFSAIGAARGYRPTPAPVPPRHPNISQGKYATQSSISDWSIGASVEQDAIGALDGNSDKEFGFHTDMEDSPWWMCDLGEIFEVECISIYNRMSSQSVRDRALPLLIQTSIDGIDFLTVHVIPTGADFGSGTNGGLSEQFSLKLNNKFRYLKLMVERKTFLHLAQVKIFGCRPL